MEEKAHWRVTYHPKVASEDIPRIDARWQREIKRAIDKRLRTDPLTFGKPLRYSLKGARALRVGNYRVLYIIRDSTVYIGAIQHRAIVYENSTSARFI